MQVAQSRNTDELFASASAEEYDYIVVNDIFVSGTKKTEKCKKRRVYAPQAERNSTPPHTADGRSVVTGYIITKRTDKPR
jgi:hypothetical protein